MGEQHAYHAVHIGIRAAFHSPNSASMEFPADYSENKFAAANLLGEVLDTSRFGRSFNQLTPVRKADRSLSPYPLSLARFSAPAREYPEQR